MCFYDQFIFSCGDYKWGHFRQHCNREYRTGETCGIKSIMQTLRVDNKCKRCEKLDTTFRRRQAEARRITSWHLDRINVPLPFANRHVHDRSIVYWPGVSSITSFGGDTKQIGTATGFAFYPDVQGLSSPDYTNPDLGQWSRMTDCGALDHLAGQDNAPILRDQRCNGDDLDPEHWSSRSDGGIAAYQTEKRRCKCGKPSSHGSQDHLSARLRTPGRKAGNTASVPPKNHIGPTAQKDTTIQRPYPRVVLSGEISTPDKKTMGRLGPAPRTPPMCKVTTTQRYQATNEVNSV